MVLGISGRREAICWTFVFTRWGCPVFTPLFTVGTNVRRVRGWSVSVVRKWVANLSLASSSATVADGSPASRKSEAVGVVLHAGRTPLAAIDSVLSMAAMCHPM
jgi:hypothetical protein